MRGRPELEAWGRDARAAPRPSTSARRTSARCSRRSSGHVDRVRRGAAGRRRRRVRRRRAAREALADLLAEARADPPNPGNAEERLPDEGNAERLAAFLADDGPTVVYFGKLIGNKGVHLLLEALDGLDARAVDRRLRRLPRGARAAGRGRRRASLFTGPLEHRHLVHLLPLADVAVVPSIFPEAFGMVAAEAAACGCPPLVARHSGLAEVAAGLEAGYPAHLRASRGVRRPATSPTCARSSRELLALRAADRAALGAAARRAVVERWSWAGVAARLLAPVA